jgi:Flp pilus assembly protein TadD/RES domain-containing protein
LGADLYRARIISEPAQIASQEDVWMAPPAYIGAGRLNDSGEPLLYTAVNGATALYEVRAKPGDMVALTRFRVTRQFQSMWLAGAIDEPGLSLASQRKLSPIMRFIEGVFTQEVRSDESHRYIAPDLLAKEFFNVPTKIDAWTYRSVADPADDLGAVNTCIRGERAKELLEYVGTDILDIRSTDMRRVQPRLGSLGPSHKTDRLLTAICQGSLPKTAIPDRSEATLSLQSGPGMGEVAALLTRRHQSAPLEVKFQKVVGEAPAGPLAELGTRYKERGQMVEAEELFRISAARGNSLGQTYLGILLAERGDNVEAEKFLRLAADAHFPFGLRCLGVLLASMGQVAAAEAAYHEAIAQGDVQSMSNLGASLHGRGHLSKAELMLRRAVAEGSTHARYGLARILIDREKKAEAESLLSEATALGQTEAKALLGILLIERGESLRGEELLHQAAASNDLVAVEYLEDLSTRRAKGS